MAVVRDSTGRWRYRKQIRLTKERTIRISGTPVLNTKLEAEKAEREHIQRALTAPPDEPSLKPKEVPTFDAFADEFMATYAKTNNRISEQMAKQGILKHHLRPAFGKLKLDAITVREIEQLKAKVLGAGRGCKRVNNILAVLSKILRYARDIGILESVPTVRLLKLPPTKFDFLTFDELEGLLDGAAVEPTFRAAIVVARRRGYGWARSSAWNGTTWTSATAPSRSCGRSGKGTLDHPRADGLGPSRSPSGWPRR